MYYPKTSSISNGLVALYGSDERIINNNNNNNNNGKSRFAAHLLENKHFIGPVDNIMETLHTTGKGRMMDTLEKFYIFRETKINKQINDKLTIKPNIILETVVQKDPHRGLSAAYKYLKNST